MLVYGYRVLFVELEITRLIAVHRIPATLPRFLSNWHGGFVLCRIQEYIQVDDGRGWENQARFWRTIWIDGYDLPFLDLFGPLGNIWSMPPIPLCKLIHQLPYSIKSYHNRHVQDVQSIDMQPENGHWVPDHSAASIMNTFWNIFGTVRGYWYSVASRLKRNVMWRNLLPKWAVFLKLPTINMYMYMLLQICEKQWLFHYSIR